MKYIRLIIMVASLVMMGIELNHIFNTPEIDSGDIMSYKRAGVFLIIILLGLWGFYKDKKRLKQHDRF